jgi:hypothetical protein
VDISAEPSSKTRAATEIGFFALCAANWEGFKNGTKASQRCESPVADVRPFKKSPGTDGRDIGTPKRVRELYHWSGHIGE